MSYRGSIENINRDREARGEKPLLPAERQLLLPLSSYVAPIDYPVGHKLVLLQLRRNELATEILEHMHEQGQWKPSANDWADMEREGLITKQRDRVTPQGLHYAQEIMRDLAHKFGIHHTSFHKGTGNRGHSVSCTCGWGTYGKQSFAGEASVRAAIGKHQRDVREGTLAPQWQTGGRT